MKLFYSLLSLMLLTLVSCNTEKQPDEVAKQEEKPVAIDYSKQYPQDVFPVFEAHGGIAKWKNQKSFSYQLGSDEEGWERQSIDLLNRKQVNEAENHLLGYDGKQVWVKEKNGVKYEGRAIFSYNLMFYFYAMPFILADDGIQYETVEPTTLQGKTYNGFKVSYNDGVGFASKDEYIVFFDPETKKMEWLAYTVTYFSKEKSDKFNIVHYSDWTTTNGLLLPKQLGFYKFDIKTSTVGDARGTSQIKNVMLSTLSPDQSIFEVPVDGKVVTE